VPDWSNPSTMLYPFVDKQGIAEHTYMIQLIGEGEKAKIMTDEKALIDALCEYRAVLCLAPDHH
jgi:hypothetical protein